MATSIFGTHHTVGVDVILHGQGTHIARGAFAIHYISSSRETRNEVDVVNGKFENLPLEIEHQMHWHPSTELTSQAIRFVLACLPFDRILTNCTFLMHVRSMDHSKHVDPSRHVPFHAIQAPSHQATI